MSLNPPGDSGMIAGFPEFSGQVEYIFSGKSAVVKFSSSTLQER